MSMYDTEVLDALKSIAKGISEQNDILNRLATMYEKSEKLKLGVLTPNEAFPEYKEQMEKRDKEAESMFKEWAVNRKDSVLLPECLNKYQPPVDEVMFKNLIDAKMALEAVICYSEKHGFISLGNYLEICGISKDYKKGDYKIGWTSEEVKLAKIGRHIKTLEPYILFPCNPHDLIEEGDRR